MCPLFFIYEKKTFKRVRIIEGCPSPKLDVDIVFQSNGLHFRFFSYLSSKSCGTQIDNKTHGAC